MWEREVKQKKLKAKEIDLVFIFDNHFKLTLHNTIFV